MKEKIQRFIQAFRMNGEVKRKTLLIGGIALALILAIVLLVCLLPRHDAPIAEPEKEPEPEKVEEEELFEPIVEPADMEKTMKKYPDVYAWLEIPGTAAILGTEADVSYPVAQHPTNRLFYLNHDLDGNQYQPGVLFTEGIVEDRIANSKDMNDPVTIIYGHNQKNRTMFGGLQAFVSKLDFSEENLMYVYQEGRRLTYQIVGGTMYSNEHILYYHDFANPEPVTTEPSLTWGDVIFNDFFANLWTGNYGSAHVDPDNMPVHGDRVLILLTCDNDTSNNSYRYLIIGKLIEDTDEITKQAAEMKKAAK